MEQVPPRARSTWPILIGLVLVAVGAAAGVYLRSPLSVQLAASFADATRSLRGPAEAPKPTAPIDPQPTPLTPPTTMAARQDPAPVPAQPVAPPVTVPPTFDIVRITPQGNAVVAGRAEPFAEVKVHDGDRVLGTAQADRNGEFVIVPDGQVMPGGRELTLSARGKDGQEIHGQDSVVVMVGPPPAPPQATADSAPPRETEPETKPVATAAIDAPVAVLLPHDDAAPRILQAPSKALALNSLDYNEQGGIRFSGSAKPSAPVRVYVDNKPVGETSTDHAGQWTLTPPASLAPGVHQLRVDELATGGQVQQRVELPFQRTITPIAGLSPGQMVVQPGNNLWRIARQTYGTGARYTVIYLANREQIRDPNRIYPGQIFAVPAAP